MSTFALSLLISLGAGVWLWNKFYRRTGGINGPAILVASVATVIIFIVLFTILNSVLPE
jgi:hypothetical protein